MGNQKETQKNPQYKYASTREKLCFGIGAIGKDAICNLVGAFLMLYFTDTLYLAPAFVGVLFFVARIWDAINDPMMGMIVDNTHTRFGKFRIWLIIGTLVNSVVFVLLFHSFNLSGTALYAYVSVMYILYGMTYTIMDVPYWSWLPNLTNDPHEREKVSVIPRFFARFNVKEESTVGVSAEKTSLKQAFHVIVKNDQLLAFIGLLLTFNLCTQIAKSFAVYYFKCICHDEYLYSIFGFAIIAEMAGLLCFPKIAAKISREKVYAFACGLPIVGFVLLGVAGYVAPQSKMLVMEEVTRKVNEMYTKKQTV